LLRQENKFSWTENHENAFRKIKEIWKSKLELFIPNNEDELELETDASSIGLGAILRQGESLYAMHQGVFRVTKRTMG
jgi:hypothetical protein